MQSGAALLKEWVDKRDYPQTRVAELFGISEGYVSMLLSAERVPGRDLATKIEDLTGIPVRAWRLSADNNREIATVALSGKSLSNKR
jgi:transcriptional regulator with XRE-family HTH domain